MDHFISLFAGLGLGALIWIIIKHFLDKDRLRQEREYLFNKEELLFYRSMWEKIIQKLLLLENHRTLLLVYLTNTCEAFNTKDVFLDINDTFNKEKFEKNQEQITSMIYMYFEDLWADWNECMDLMSKLMNLLLHIELNSNKINANDLTKIVDEFNKINAEELKDKPLDISKKIKKIIQEKMFLIKQ